MWTFENHARIIVTEYLWEIEGEQCCTRAVIVDEAYSTKSAGNARAMTETLIFPRTNIMWKYPHSPNCGHTCNVRACNSASVAVKIRPFAVYASHTFHDSS